MIIYDAMKDVTAMRALLPRIYDIPYGAFVKGEYNKVNPKDFNVIVPEKMTTALAHIPKGGIAHLDVEPNPSRPDVNAHLADLIEYPEQAIDIRLRTLAAAKEVRPDLRYTMWGIPHSVKDLHLRWDEYYSRELACLEITVDLDLLSINNYPRFRNHDTWKERTQQKLGMAKLVHGNKPVLSWYAASPTNKKWLKEDIDYCRELGYDGFVFWDRKGVTALNPQTAEMLLRAQQQ